MLMFDILQNEWNWSQFEKKNGWILRVVTRDFLDVNPESNFEVEVTISRK